jgi:UDP:flavonoid glycosyltransferase YjiC (YdhE family)
MKISLLSSGSDGDAQPATALAATLTARCHATRLVATASLGPLKAISRPQWNAAFTRAPVLPDPTPAGALSAQLRRS